MCSIRSKKMKRKWVGEYVGGKKTVKERKKY
jgi:hypothetical protein